MRNIVFQENIFEQLMSEDELIRFSMFYAIRSTKDSFIVTNDTNIIIGQERPTAPLWIYIKNDLSSDEREDIIKIICERLTNNPSLKIDGEEKYLEPILREVSSISGIPFKISIMKNSYVCRKPIQPKMIYGGLSEANENDLEILTIFSKDNWQDIGFGMLTSDQAKKFAQRKLDNPDFHVWRNDDDRIVAMATVHKYMNVAITDGVFADRNERNKGYARFLVCKITKDLLNRGFIPMLYADREKPIPNHIYKSIGYEYYGEITEYRFL